MAIASGETEAASREVSTMRIVGRLRLPPERATKIQVGTGAGARATWSAAWPGIRGLPVAQCQYRRRGAVWS